MAILMLNCNRYKSSIHNIIAVAELHKRKWNFVRRVVRCCNTSCHTWTVPLDSPVRHVPTSVTWRAE